MAEEVSSVGLTDGDLVGDPDGIPVGLSDGDIVGSNGELVG